MRRSSLQVPLFSSVLVAALALAVLWLCAMPPPSAAQYTVRVIPGTNCTCTNDPNCGCSNNATCVDASSQDGHACECGQGFIGVLEKDVLLLRQRRGGEIGREMERWRERGGER